MNILRAFFILALGLTLSPRATMARPQSPNASTSAAAIPPGPMFTPPAHRCGELPIDQAWLRARMGRLSGETPALIHGLRYRLGERYSSWGRVLARFWLRLQYEQLGYKVQEQRFAQGVNLIASKPGTSPGYYVFSAHYDTVDASPGADDDASGVITSLAIAAALAPCDLDVGIKFVAFDQEERGMTGSFHYAGDLRKRGQSSLLRGLIQVEMTGYDGDGDGAFNLVNCSQPRNSFLTQVMQNALRLSGEPLYPVTACTYRSDHQAIWSIDRPAIAVSQLFFAEVPDRTACYHKACDQYDKIDFAYMERLTKVLTRAALLLTRPISGWHQDLRRP